LFALAGAGGVTVLLLHGSAPRAVMLFGTVALFVGVGITLLAITGTSTAVFFVGTAVAGVGFGAGFQGALRTVIPLAAPHERAGLLSTVYVVCYLAMGLPAVVGGFLVVHGGGVLSTGREYGAAVMLLAALALLGLTLTRPAPTPGIEPDRAVPDRVARRTDPERAASGIRSNCSGRSAAGAMTLATVCARSEPVG
jgi:hypothetical protein